MKRYSTKTWAAAVVLAISVADCVGIYVAQVRLHREVPVSAPETAYADATAAKDTWRGSGPSPQAQRAYANAMTYAPAAAVPTAATPVAQPVAPTVQQLAQVDVKVPAFKPRTDAFLAPPKLAAAAPPERVELATAVHAVQHRAAVHRASARLAQRDVAPPTSLSFAAAFGGNGTGTLVLPEPTFGKQADAGSVTGDSAKDTPSVMAIDSPHIDIGDSATTGKSAALSADALDPELPAVAPAVQSAAQPGS